MVRAKTGGGDPAELVRQKIEDFRLEIQLRAAVRRPMADRAARKAGRPAYSGRP